MIVVFKDICLQELYVNGKTSNKKYRFQPQIVKAY